MLASKLQVKGLYSIKPSVTVSSVIVFLLSITLKLNIALSTLVKVPVALVVVWLPQVICWLVI